MTLNEARCLMAPRLRNTPEQQMTNAAQAINSEPMVTITMTVPLSSLDLSECGCSRYSNKSEFWGQVQHSYQYECDTDDATYNGFNVEIHDNDLSAVESLLIEQRWES